MTSSVFCTAFRRPLLQSPSLRLATPGMWKAAATPLSATRSTTEPVRAAATATAPRPLPQLPGLVDDLSPLTCAPIHQAKALHPAFYMDPAYVAAERDRIFGTNWFAACHVAEVSSPGDVKVVDVGGTSIILTCDKDRKVRAFYNVCRHRGARVAQGAAKSCKQLVCPYHWWAYRLDGSLKSTPPAAMPKQRKSELGLRAIPGVETFAGMVFLNQSLNPPPLLDTLGDLPKKLARYDLADMTISGIKPYEIRGDWKLIAENFVDFYHINAVHPELAKFSRVDDHLPYQGSGQYVGFVTAPLTDSGGPGDSDKFNHFQRISRTEAGAALFFQIFPNVSVTIYPHSVYTLMTFPTHTAGVTQEQLTLLMAPGARKSSDSNDEYEEKNRQLLRFVSNINDEDVTAIENLQVGLHNAVRQGMSGEFLPHYDWPIHRFQNMVLNGLHGQPLNEEYMPTLDNNFELSVMAEEER